MLTLHDSPEEAEFRTEIRDWAAAHLPERLRWSDDFETLLEVDRVLSTAHLLGISWPVPYGGRGAAPALEAVLTEELGAVGVRRARCPSHQGVNNLAPALMAHGTEAQKEFFLPKILSVEQVWCQGFSEPDAGSDLANVRTTAVRDGDDFIVNGSKTWTSYAHEADWIFALVRTGTVEQRHRGLSFLLFRTDTPGITVRPIQQITGRAEFCEVFFDNVIVPANGLVGSIGQGWQVAMTLLASERLSGRYRYATFHRAAQELARSAGPDAGPGFLAELGAAVAAIEGMGALSLHVDSLRAAGRDTAAQSSVNKLWWPLAHQRFLELALRNATRRHENPSRWYWDWLDARPESIYGGSAQVQRNIISERHLHMPRSAR